MCKHDPRVSAALRTTHGLTCTRVLESQHRVVENQQIREPHGGTQVVEKVPHRVAEPLQQRERAVRVRHPGWRKTRAPFTRKELWLAFSTSGGRRLNVDSPVSVPLFTTDLLYTVLPSGLVRACVAP